MAEPRAPQGDLGLAPGAAAERRAAAGSGEVWTRLAAPMPLGELRFRQDGAPVDRPQGQQTVKVARFVIYLDRETVWERLEAVARGLWSLELTPLAGMASDGGEIEGRQRCAFKARLTVCGVTREDVGQGSDYKAAATDAFKRAAAQFGVGHEIRAYPQVWLRVEVRGKYAKPLDDPHDRLAELLRRAQPTNARSA